MIKLNTAKNMGDAYMLRRDGSEIWVDVHPYGVTRTQKNTRECNLLPAVFLAKYSEYNRTEAIQFINSYLAELVLQADDTTAEKLDNPTEIRKYLMQKIREMPSTYIQVLEWKGIVGDSSKNAMELVSWYDPKYFSTYDEAFDVDTRLNGIDLATALNQEFIRIRIGGRYDSYGDGVYYARIGSTGFNWSDLIKQSVREHKRPDDIGTVCIERDSESDTGDPFSKDSIYAYKTDDGDNIENMPVDVFLASPVSLLSSIRQDEGAMEKGIRTLLSETASIQKLRSIPMNSARLFRTIRQLCLGEREGLDCYKAVRPAQEIRR